MADSLITQVKRLDDGTTASTATSGSASNGIRGSSSTSDGRVGGSGGGGSGGSGGGLFCCCCGGGDDDTMVINLNRGNGGGGGGGGKSGGPIGDEEAPEDRRALLGARQSQDRGRKTLVLDLDETLVHSSFKPVASADFVIPVEIDNQVHQVFVIKRPYVDQFMKRMGDLFEVVVFTASLAKYADPVLDLLDKYNVVSSRLFREHCSNFKGNYVKDMSRLGRPLKDSIIVDNSPASYIWHPENAVPIGTWFDDMDDTELLDLIPFLEDMAKVDDVRTVLDTSRRP